MPGSKFVTGLLEETDRLSLVPIRARPGARCSPIRKSLHPTERSWEHYILGRNHCILVLKARLPIISNYLP